MLETRLSFDGYVNGKGLDRFLTLSASACDGGMGWGCLDDIHAVRDLDWVVQVDRYSRTRWWREMRCSGTSALGSITFRSGCVRRGQRCFE